MELPEVAECGHCGQSMVLIDGLYYVHADTGKTYCPALEEAGPPLA